MASGENPERQDDARLTEGAREAWNRFVVEHSGSFLQSWEWGEFQQSVGRSIRRFVLCGEEWKPWDDLVQKLKVTRQRAGSFTLLRQPQNSDEFMRRHPERSEGSRYIATSDVPRDPSVATLPQDDRWDGVVQFIEMTLPLGKTYWYGPRAPALEIRNQKSEIRNNLQIPTSKFQTLNAPDDVVFLRLEPAWPAEYKNVFIENGWRQTYEIQPRRNWVLDIAKTDEGLLAAMHPKTKYNIRIASGKCSVRRENDSVEDFERFWGLMAETAGRHHIRSHPKKYYHAMLRMPTAELWQAECEGQIIASHIVVFFGKRATYLHGASAYEHRSLMAPYLLHWAVIKEARRRGLTEYDFGGVDETGWPGLTRFKRGFGGRAESFVGAFDFALKPFWYTLYRAAKRLS